MYKGWLSVVCHHGFLPQSSCLNKDIINMKKIMISALLATALTPAFAQENGAKTEYVFKPHFYVQAQAGGGYTLGEIDFSKLTAFNGQLGLGYQISPVVGLRLSANGWTGRGGIDFQGNEYKWKYKYVAPMLDFTVNLSNLVCGFNPNRVFNLSAFLGAGANIAWDNDEAASVSSTLTNLTKTTTYGGENLEYLWDGTATRFVGRGGIQADFRVSERVSIGLEVNANVLNDHYNSKKAHNADWYFNALAGVKINLGKTYEEKIIPAPEPEIRYVDRVVEKIVEKEVPAATVKEEAIRRDVFFKINKFAVTPQEQSKIDDIVAYMQKNPNSKVSVTGYADAGTGNNTINDRLARQRAASVVKALTNKGIDASRITSDSKGARVQPFAENNKNRVTIMIAE